MMIVVPQVMNSMRITPPFQMAQLFQQCDTLQIFGLWE